MNRIDRQTEQALRDFTDRLRLRYCAHSKAAERFASRVRGDFITDSDTDIAVFLDHNPDPLRQQIELIDGGHAILLSLGVNIQP